MVISLGRIFGRLPGGTRSYANVPGVNYDEIVLLAAKFGATVVGCLGYIYVADRLYYAPKKIKDDQKEDRRLAALFELEREKRFNQVLEEMKK